MVVDDTLLETLAEHPSTLNTEYYLNLAVSVTPPASATHVRALAAKAVLSSGRREANIVAALEALPPTSPGASTMNLVNHAPATPDVHMALTIAKLLALNSPTSPRGASERAYDVIATMQIPPGSYTLLTAVAAYRLLRTTSADCRLPIRASRGTEDMAANLRLWLGTSAGRKAGLERGDCGRVVEVCLGVARKVGGWEERDSGYGGSPEGSPVRSRAEIGGPGLW
ncbi:Clr6 histone deacetylase associated PHD protein-2 Cph2 [Teratosphaeriaceae sp. CCFEE 6253]|nr:Clr6 histone deacetylase associated PHD protein-2 Cph2 [Teratosphaeriaceae sp. CCFEE 6253]